MNVTKDGFKDRQLHMEDYLQMVPAEQKEHAGVSVYQRITENNDIITDFSVKCSAVHTCIYQGGRSHVQLS